MNCGSWKYAGGREGGGGGGEGEGRAGGGGGREGGREGILRKRQGSSLLKVLEKKTSFDWFSHQFRE